MIGRIASASPSAPSASSTTIPRCIDTSNVERDPAACGPATCNRTIASSRCGTDGRSAEIGIDAPRRASAIARSQKQRPRSAGQVTSHTTTTRFTPCHAGARIAPCSPSTPASPTITRSRGPASRELTSITICVPTIQHAYVLVNNYVAAGRSPARLSDKRSLIPPKISSGRELAHRGPGANRSTFSLHAACARKARSDAGSLRKP